MVPDSSKSLIVICLIIEDDLIGHMLAVSIAGASGPWRYFHNCFDYDSPAAGLAVSSKERRIIIDLLLEAI